MAGAGYRRDAFQFQTPTVTANTVGQQSTAWTNVVIIAGVKTPTQREVMDDMGVAIRTDVVIESSWHPQITAGGRLIDQEDNRTYNITGVVDPDGGRKRRLRITATLVDSADGIGAGEPEPA
jgi:head-tail adaptor